MLESFLFEKSLKINNLQNQDVSKNDLASLSPKSVMHCVMLGA